MSVILNPYQDTNTVGDMAMWQAIGRRLSGAWFFNLGAWAYNLLTANPVWQASCARLLNSWPLPPGPLHVLDLGVGPGVSALMMGQQQPDLGLVGLDVAGRMLAAAAANRRQVGWPGERLSLVQADALRLPLADGTMAGVTGHSFLYMLPDCAGVLKEANRVLRPGGVVAFLEPHAGRASWSWLVRQASGRLLVSLSLWRLYSRMHRRFSAASLSAGLAGAGFEMMTTEVTLGGFGIFGRARKP